MLRIKDLPTTEERHQNPQEAIGNASQGATVRVPPRSKSLVVRTTRGIGLRANAGPMVPGIAQPEITRIAHRDGAAASALFRHRRDAHGAAQDVIGSIDQRLRGLGEHSGGDASPDSWHGADDSDVRMLALVPRRWQLRLQGIQQASEGAFRLPALSGNQRDTREQQLEMRRDGLRHAGGAV